MQVVKIGVLGCAKIAERAIIPAITSLTDKFLLTGISSRDHHKADRFAEIFKSTPFYSYDALLDKQHIDAVYIPLPNSLHFMYAKKALERGIHVLVEKPLACSYDEVTTLVSLASKMKLALVENFQFRFHSQMQYLSKLISSGELGSIRTVRVGFGFPPFFDKSNIRYQKDLCGGALLDAGAYTTKFSQIILGMGLSVGDSVLNKSIDSEVDIWGGGLLKQINGTFSQISFGFDNFYQCGAEIWLSQGKVSTNRLFTSPPDYEPLYTVESEEGVISVKLPPDNHFINMLEYFYQCIFNDNLKVLEYDLNLDQSRILQELKDKGT